MTLLASVMVTGASAGSTLDVVSPFLNLGLAGVVVLMVVFRKGVVPEWTLRQAEERIKARDAKIEALEARVQDSTDLIVQQVVPLLTRAVDVESKYLDQMKQEGRDDRDDRRPTRPSRGR